MLEDIFCIQRYILKDVSYQIAFNMHIQKHTAVSREAHPRAKTARAEGTSTASIYYQRFLRRPDEESSHHSSFFPSSLPRNELPSEPPGLSWLTLVKVP